MGLPLYFSLFFRFVSAVCELLLKFLLYFFSSSRRRKPRKTAPETEALKAEDPNSVNGNSRSAACV